MRIKLTINPRICRIIVKDNQSLKTKELTQDPADRETEKRPSQDRDAERLVAGVL
jgi:hypothetical protein